MNAYDTRDECAYPSLADCIEAVEAMEDERQQEAKAA